MVSVGPPLFAKPLGSSAMLASVTLSPMVWLLAAVLLPKLQLASSAML
jgi:hypothetical protein